MRRAGLSRAKHAAIGVFLALLALVVPQAAPAQQIGLPDSQILTISPERLFQRTLFGQRIDREIEAQSQELAAENRRIEAELMAEEEELTRQRPSLEPAEFRGLADAFDKKVQEIRLQQDAKARTLTQKLENNRRLFLTSIRPVLGAIMQETGAAVILDRASVFLSANAADITDLATMRIDAELGDGAHLGDPNDP